MSNLRNSKPARVAGVLSLVLLATPFLAAQDRDRDFDRDRDRDRAERIEPGTTVLVRTNETIDVERQDNRVYTGIVDQDVRGEDGRLAIPRGARVELIVRVAPDNDLILDLESINVNGQRYGVRADANRIESKQNVVGSILGSISGGEVRGRAVRVPRDSVLNFRLERPLTIGEQDRGYDRDGNHFHGDR